MGFIRTGGQLSPACPQVKVLSRSTASDCDPHGLWPSRLLCLGILQARILEWVAIPFCRGSPPRDRTLVSYVAGRFLLFEPPGRPCVQGGGEKGSYCQCRRTSPSQSVESSDTETIYLRLGLEPTWLRLKPSQTPACALNPHVWDSNPAKTHSTWFQDLMKLRFLMSHHRMNLMRDKVIGKKWIYSDTERSTLHRQSVGHRRGQRKP